ncbi:MAG: 4,5-DOPA dioxygenase extradiol [Bacteroidota bacterium]
MKLNTFGNIASETGNSDVKMPALFIGHGSPMNAIENNEFTRTLTKLGKTLPKPKAILCISAHWMTKGTFVNISPNPKMIYDMYGFPKELYEVQYPAKGSPETAKETQDLATKTKVLDDTKWGYDHGNWSVMKHLYPDADIPLFQMSIDYDKPMQYHYDLAKELKDLRNKGVLIVGSGNITHNLGRVDFSGLDAPVQDWAQEFDTKVKQYIDTENHQALINYSEMGKSASLAVPEPSHYIPFMYTLGLQGKGEASSYIYEGFHYGTLSMRAVRVG